MQLHTKGLYANQDYSGMKEKQTCSKCSVSAIPGVLIVLVVLLLTRCLLLMCIPRCKPQIQETPCSKSEGSAVDVFEWVEVEELVCATPGGQNL